MRFLETERLDLFVLSLDDLNGAYGQWINSQGADRYTQHAQFPHSREELADYYRARTASRNGVWLGIRVKQGGKHVGNIDVSSIDWVHRSGVYNILIGDETEQGKGYGFEASVAILHHVFVKLNLNRVQLGVHEANAPARRLYERLGFREEGRLRRAFLRDGKFADTIVMGLLAEEFREAAPRYGVTLL